MKKWTRIAHRGGGGLAPENTLGAFQNALRIGTDVIEIDVHLSKDGEVVVIHDETLDRTTDRTGIVSELTLAEIREADAGVRFSEDFRGERVPTLAETLECIPVGTQLLIEFKAPLATLPALDVVHDMGRDDQILVVSFDQDVIRTAHCYRAEIPRALSIGAALVEDDPERNMIRMHQSAVHAGASILDLMGRLVTPESIQLGHRRGACIWLWTLNEREHIRMAVDADVDGITSDYPDRLNEVW